MTEHDPLCWMPSSAHAGVCFAGINQIRADEQEALREEGWWTPDAHRTAMDALEDWARTNERERIARAIEAARLDPKVQGRLTVENRDYPLTRDDVLIINGVRNADARIARDGGGG